MGRLRGLVDRAQRRSTGVRTGVLVLAAARRQWRNARGDDSNPGGVRHSGKLDIDASVAYVERLFDEYVREARRRYPDFSLVGRRVLEVGPGDTDAVAVLLVAAGASEVVAIDRFRPHRDEEVNSALCAAVMDRFDPDRFGLDAVGPLDVGTARSRVRYVHGQPLETATPESLGRFDLIVSAAVLEHVYDLRESFAAMRRLCADGAVIAHNVDLSEHGMFSKHGHHPLTHLTVPERLYRRIARPGGAPNRALGPEYRRCLDKVGFDAAVRVTRNLFRDPDRPDVRAVRDTPVSQQLASIRPSLRSRFAGHSDQDLNAASIFIVGHVRA